MDQSTSKWHINFFRFLSFSFFSPFAFFESLERKKKMQVKSVGINRIVSSSFVLSCACSSVHPWRWGWTFAAP